MSSFLSVALRHGRAIASPGVLTEIAFLVAERCTLRGRHKLCRRWQSSAISGGNAARPSTRNSPRLSAAYHKRLTLNNDLDSAADTSPEWLKRGNEKGRCSSKDKTKLRPHKRFLDETGQLDRARVYKYYLDGPEMVPSFDDPAEWVLDLNLQDIRKELPPALHERPLDFFLSSSCDLSVAKTCLEAYLASTRPGTRSKEDLREELCSPHNRPGSRALSWTLKGYNQLDLSGHVGFLKPLIHCLLAEKEGEKSIWQWLQAREIFSLLSSQRQEEKDAWRGAVLRFLVESQTYWAECGGINPALQSYIHARSISKPGTPSWIPSAAAEIWISKQLMFKGANVKADPDLFDRFVDLVAPEQKNRIKFEFERSELLLYHPSQATGLQAYTFFKRYKPASPRPIFLRNMFQSVMGRGFIVKSARVLEKNSHEYEARWMLDVGFEEMPEIFGLGVRPDQRGRQIGLGASKSGVQQPVRYHGRDPDREASRRLYTLSSARGNRHQARDQEHSSCQDDRGGST